MAESDAVIRGTDASPPGKHLTAEGQGKAPQRSFSHAQSLKLILDLSLPNPQSLEDAIQSFVALSQSEEPEEEQKLPDDLLAWATTLAVSRLAEVVPEHHPGFRELRPDHRDWILLCRMHRLAFAHLVLEELRDMALSHEHDAVKALQSILNALYQEANGEGALTALGESLCEGAPRRFHDLAGLACAYLAAAFQVAGDHRRTAVLIARADHELAQGTDHNEPLRATVHVVRSDIARRQDQHLLALREIRSARRRQLESAPDRACDEQKCSQAQRMLQEIRKERLAEIDAREGVILIRLGRTREAVSLLDSALGLIPEGNNPRLRRYVHYHLARAELRSGQFTAAEQHLTQAEALSRSGVSAAIAARQQWLRGLIELNIPDCRDQAAISLNQAVDSMKNLGLHADAVLALSQLCQLYADDERFDELLKLSGKFKQLLASTPARCFTRAQIRKLDRIAQALGIDLSEVTASGENGPVGGYQIN